MRSRMMRDEEPDEEVGGELDEEPDDEGPDKEPMRRWTVSSGEG